MLWMAYRHGLRVGELVGLRWAAHIDFDTGSIRVERLKNGIASVHPLGERELRGLRWLQKGKRCLGGTFRCARGRVMFEADARASTHVDFRA
jgi:type 1 fimbriae regulatory protein FimB/type 1 fimbriae regulatory protein FimE